VRLFVADELVVAEMTEQLIRVDRLEEISLAEALKGSKHLDRAGHGRRHNDPRAISSEKTCAFFCVTHAPQCFLPVHLGHHNVHADEIVARTRFYRLADGPPQLLPRWPRDDTPHNVTRESVAVGGW
jgi:hypothetical protein